MKRLCKILTACAALTLTSTTIKAQSCDAAYPAGMWQTNSQGEKDPTYFVNMEIWRVKDECGSLVITEYATEKELFSGILSYAGKEMKNDVPTGTYYFDVKEDNGQKCTISVNGSRTPVIIGTGKLKDHPAFKEDINPCNGLMLGTGGGTVALYANSEKDLLQELRWVLEDKRMQAEGFGNIRQYVNAHANLNPALPKYAKPKGAGAINIRDKASTTAEKVAELKPGETLLVIDEYDGWCQVKLGEDKTGWVSLSVVTLTNTKGRTPAATTSFILGNGKLGPLSIGQAVSALPKSVPGLYDRYVVKKESFADEDGEWEETFCHFYKGGKLIFKAGVSDSKQIASFTLEKGSEFIKTTEGFHVGYSARDLFTRKPMEWETWYQGTTFARSGQWEYRILSDDLINADIPTKPSDIKATGKILTITHYKDSPQE